MAACLSRPRKTTCLAPPPGGAERRTAVRYRCRLSCQCSVIALARRSTPWRARIQDISVNGIRLLVGGPVALGRFLAIGLHSPHGDFVRQVQARVIRISRNGQGRSWDVACSLSCGLSEEELDELVL